MNLRQTGELANKAAAVQWVKWVHPYTEPAYSNPEKHANVLKVAVIRAHCAKCLNMNGCCFAEDKCPKSPLHENCHCRVEHVDSLEITVECPIEKISVYIFNPTEPNGKKKIFTDRGFSIADSAGLKRELERQAYNAYISGNYVLHDFDDYGQRINIVIVLKCPNGETIKFISGWLVYPNGKIANSTPCRGILI